MISNLLQLALRGNSTFQMFHWNGDEVMMRTFILFWLFSLTSPSSSLTHHQLFLHHGRHNHHQHHLSLASPHDVWAVKCYSNAIQLQSIYGFHNCLITCHHSIDFRCISLLFSSSRPHHHHHHHLHHHRRLHHHLLLHHRHRHRYHHHHLRSK